MGGGSFQDAVRRRQAAGFVARADELARFRANLALPADDPDHRFVFAVHGDGGVGKTFLTQRLRSIADGHGAATGWADERVFGVPDAMRAIAGDLTRRGGDMSGFDKLLGNYLKRRNEVEADPNAPAGTAAFITKTAVRVGLHAAHAVPGVGGVVESVDAGDVAEQADRLRMFLGKKFRSHEDVRLLMSPAEALSPAFVTALARTGRRKPLALFFDTYEQTGAFLDGWLRSMLDGTYGDLPETLVVTVASRHPLDPGDWADYAAVLADVPLAPFTDAEARQLLAAKGVTDERVAEVILNLSGRLPLLVAMLAENQPTDPGQVGDPSGDAVERFLKWETDPERRALAVAAALPRVVSEDVLGVLTTGRELDEAGRGRLYGWLRSQPFVTRDAGRCVYHDVVRTTMIRSERGRSPVRWRDRHQALAAAYRQWRETAFPEDAWSDAGWRSYRLEEAYHLLCADPAEQLPAALTDFVHALASGLAAAVKWAQMILQAGGDRDAAAVLNWGRRLEEAARGSHKEAAVACLTLLLRDRAITEEAVPVALRTRGRALYWLERDAEALADLDAALKLDPMDKQALSYRGDCYRWLGRHEQALADFNRAIELDRDYALAICKRGEAHALLGRYDEALTDFDRAIELNPSYDWAIAERGQVYSLAGRYEEALADLDRAIELNPQLDWAITERGEVHRLAGRPDQAIADFNRAIELNPDFAEAIAGRGETHRLADRPEEAIADFNRAIELDPGYAWVIASRGQANRAAGRLDQAISDLDRAIELDPELDWAFGERGEAHLLAERYEEAIADFTRAIELDPGNGWAVAGRGQAYRQTRCYNLAITDLDRAIELDPQLASTLAERGNIHRLAGRIEEAIGDFCRAIELDPDYAWAIEQRGEAYRLAGRFDEALADIDRAIGLESGDWVLDDWILFQRSLVLTCRGDDAEAATDIATAVRLVSEHLGSAAASGHDAYNVGLYRAASGDLEQARGDLGRAIESFPDVWLMREALDDLRDLARVPGIDHAGIAPLIELLTDAATAIELRVPVDDGLPGLPAAGGRAHSATRRSRAMKIASVPWRCGQSWAKRGSGARVPGTSCRTAGASMTSVPGRELTTSVTTAVVSAGTGEQVT